MMLCRPTTPPFVVFLCLVAAASPLSTFAQSGAASSLSVADDIDRSPNALAFSPDGKRFAVVNHTSDSIAVLSVDEQKLLHESPCLVEDGQAARRVGPWDILWLDDRHLAVSLLHRDQLAIYETDDESLTLKELISVGDEPRGLALQTTGNSERTIFVCLTEEDAVAAVSLPDGEMTARIEVGGHPRTIAVSPDQQWLVTCCSTPGEVFVHDARTKELKQKRFVFDRAFSLGKPFINADSTEVYVTGQINRAFPIHPDNIERGWAIDNRVTKVPLPEGPYWMQKQLGLDPRGNAAGDANAVAISPDGVWWAITCGGSHELMLLNNEAMVWPSADPGDFLPPLFQHKPNMLRRIELGGRPCDLAFVDDRTVWVANYLSNAIQIVDIDAGKVTKTIQLGGPSEPSLARRGEIIFYDADRTFNSWFSCHTCHTDGHTSGQTFDTLNDGTLDTFKLVPSLRGVTHTGPWTWHGWQHDLHASIKKSLTDTMNSEIDIEEDDLAALYAFLETLTHPAIDPPESEEHAAGIERGREVFIGKGGCVTCHAGQYFTKSESIEVGLETSRDYYKGFNPPSLRGLRHRRRFLHDGRAESLDDVLTGGHAPEKVAGEKLTDAERRDLIAFLRSL